MRRLLENRVVAGMLVKSLVVVLVAYGAYKIFIDVGSEIPEDAVRGKRVVVTGASQNIGEQLAYEYCRRGASLFITARREDRLKQVQAECLQLGATSCGYQTLDMSNLTQIPHFVENAAKFMGGIDYLVLNHIMRSGPSNREWTGSQENLRYLDESVVVNYLSYIHLSTAAQRHLARSERGGLVVVSSMAGLISNVNMTAYGASKAALNRFYDNLRFEMLATGREDFTITCCMLGVIDTRSDYSKGRNYKISAYPVDRTAVEILEAGYLEKRTAFIPSYTKYFHYLSTFFSSRFLDRKFIKFVYDIDV